MKKWSNKHLCCIECGTTRKLHEAKGFCSKCYRRRHYLSKEKIQRFFKFYKEKKRLYMKGQQGKLVKIRHKDKIIDTPFLIGQAIGGDDMQYLQNYLKKGGSCRVNI